MTMTAEAAPDCPLCPRLVAYRKDNAAEHPDWFNGAVPSFGSATAQLLIIGLAPGVTGANRTGRPFTGDWAGDLLYKTLDHFGFSQGQYAQHASDGLELVNAMITNAVRCVPPQNKPTGAEIKQCRPYLSARIKAMPNLKIMLCLGKIAHDSTVAAFGARQKDHPFGHGNRHLLGGYTLYDSYHCSRYNTNTGRLTEDMFFEVFAAIKRELGS
ncbi:MAG: uracil-DNA glycosylase [Parvibaculales bacterium]